jgi:glutathione S-transferase
MKLYSNRTTPFGRKVLVVAHEKNLVQALENIEVDPWADPANLHAATPVGKVPALVTGDGIVLTESTIITEYLDEQGDGRPLFGGNRWEVMGRVGLAQGVMEAALGIVIEQRRRPPEYQWPGWIERLSKKIERTVAQASPPQQDRFDMGDISWACALGYVDFRLPDIAWRKQHPELAAWFADVSKRPSMIATAPPT